MAYMLAHYLEPSTRYEGFDIMKPLVQWAQGAISCTAPHFQFKHVDVYNKHYNPTGTIRGSAFRFPYPDESFDLILLTSVFTHMLPDEVRHYLDEFRRVLKPGGHCFTTCFLMNEESRTLIAKGQSSQKLTHRLGECYTTTLEDVEASIGYDESLLLSWIAERGFTLQSKHYGFWCDRPRFTSYQDFLVFRKPLASAIRKAG
jgi:SAM-dependent methyltransferase